MGARVVIRLLWWLVVGPFWLAWNIVSCPFRLRHKVRKWQRCFDRGRPRRFGGAHGRKSRRPALRPVKRSRQPTEEAAVPHWHAELAPVWRGTLSTDELWESLRRDTVWAEEVDEPLRATSTPLEEEEPPADGAREFLEPRP